MPSDALTLRQAAPRDEAVLEAHRTAYLTGLGAPMDDMWIAFANAATPHVIEDGERILGSVRVDGDGRLLRFHMEPGALHRATEAMGLAAHQLEVAEAMVFTVDPLAVSTAIDLARAVESHTLLFEHAAAPTVAAFEELAVAAPDDHTRLVEFDVTALGAPVDFLGPYLRERVDRREALVHEDGGEIACLGELRRDPEQAGVAQLGVVVGPEHRGRGLASRMMTSLAARARAEGLTPYCSTERTNLAACRAIERAGFRSRHRGLRVTFGG